MANIIIIEDDPSTRELLKRRAQGLGHQVEALGSAGEGISAVLGRLPDLVVMDQRLVTMDGLEAVKMLRNQGYTGKIVMCSGMAENELKERALKAGCDAFIEKPVSGNYTATIEKLLGAG